MADFDDYLNDDDSGDEDERAPKPWDDARDIYDFDAAPLDRRGEEGKRKPKKESRLTPSQRPVDRQLSTDDRIQEILARSRQNVEQMRASSPSPSLGAPAVAASSGAIAGGGGGSGTVSSAAAGELDDAGTRSTFTDFAESLRRLRENAEGRETGELAARSGFGNDGFSPASSIAGSGRGSGGGGGGAAAHGRQDSDADSLDISEADFEVGGYSRRQAVAATAAAARRSAAGETAGDAGAGAGAGRAAGGGGGSQPLEARADAAEDLLSGDLRIQRQPWGDSAISAGAEAASALGGASSGARLSAADLAVPSPSLPSGLGSSLPRDSLDGSGASQRSGYSDMGPPPDYPGVAVTASGAVVTAEVTGASRERGNSARFGSGSGGGGDGDASGINIGSPTSSHRYSGSDDGFETEGFGGAPPRPALELSQPEAASERAATSPAGGTAAAAAAQGSHDHLAAPVALRGDAGRAAAAAAVIAAATASAAVIGRVAAPVSAPPSPPSSPEPGATRNLGSFTPGAEPLPQPLFSPPPPPPPPPLLEPEEALLGTGAAAPPKGAADGGEPASSWRERGDRSGGGGHGAASVSWQLPSPPLSPPPPPPPEPADAAGAGGGAASFGVGSASILGDTSGREGAGGGGGAGGGSSSGREGAGGGGGGGGGSTSGWREVDGEAWDIPGVAPTFAELHEQLRSIKSLPIPGAAPGQERTRRIEAKPRAQTGRGNSGGGVAERARLERRYKQLQEDLGSSGARRRRRPGTAGGAAAAGAPSSRAVLESRGLDPGDLSAVHWALSNKERDLRARELALAARERTAAAATAAAAAASAAAAAAAAKRRAETRWGDLSAAQAAAEEERASPGWLQESRLAAGGGRDGRGEVEAGPLERELEATKTELERARAEAYALKVQLEIKRDAAATAAASAAASPAAAKRQPKRTTTGSAVRPAAAAAAAAKKSSGKAAGAAAETATETGEEDASAAESAADADETAELEALRREVATQERLIAGYQKESEATMLQMKQAEERHVEKRTALFHDRERLTKELNALRNAAAAAGAGAGGAAATADALLAAGEAVAMREEMARQNAEWRERESELKFEVDRLRRGKREAEARASGVLLRDIDGPDPEVARTRAEAAEERRKAAAELSRLRSKLEWYTENQELLEEKAATVADQAREIEALRRALQEKGAAAESGGGGDARGDARRVKELEAQLREMEEALRRRNPDCLANLIRAARPNESLELRADETNRRAASLAAELERTKQEAELKMRSLRQEHDRMRLGFQKRIDELSAAADKRSGAGGGGGGGGTAGGKAGAQDRVLKLEKELESVRAFYSHKLADVERRAEAQIRAIKRGSTGGFSFGGSAGPAGTDAGGGGSGTGATAVLQERLRRAEREAEERARYIEQLESRLASSSTAAAAAEAETGRAAGKSGDLGAPVAAAAGSGAPDRASSAAATGEAAAGSSAEDGSPHGPQQQQQQQQQPRLPLTQAYEARVEALELRLAGMSAALGQAQAQANAWRNAAAGGMPTMESFGGVAAGGARQDIVGAAAAQRLQQDVARLTAELARTEEARRALEGECLILREEAERRRRLPSTPGEAQFRALSAAVEAMERRAERRERELEAVMAGVREAGRLEAARLQALHEEEMRGKDETLLRFRAELDGLLAALRAVQIRAAARKAKKISASANSGCDDSLGELGGAFPGILAAGAGNSDPAEAAEADERQSWRQIGAAAGGYGGRMSSP